MTTAIAMISRAMRLAGIFEKGSVPDADEAADGLASLNSMLESWSLERLFVPYIVSEQLTLVANTATYTMGPSGNLNTSRPTRIEEGCFVRTTEGMDYGLMLIDQLQYAGIVAKTVTTTIPAYLFVDMQYPQVNLTFYPVPSSTYTAHIKSWKILQSFAALTTELILPAGWERAIVFSLAEEFGIEFDVDVPIKVQQIALKARANVKRINAPAPVMNSEVGYLNTFTWGGTYPAIYAG